MSKKFIISAFADEAYRDLEKQLPFLQKLGIKYFEPRYVQGNYAITDISTIKAKKVKEQMDEYDIKASCIGAWLGKISITDPLEPHLELLRHSIEIAHILDTKRLRTFSFYLPEGDPIEKWRGEVMERLAKMADIAEKEGVILMHENEHRIYGESPEGCVDIFKTIKSPALSGTFDPANYIYFNYDPKAAYDMVKDYTTYFHMKDAVPQVEMRPVGYGDGRVAEVLAAAPDREEPYFLTIEPHIGDFQGIEEHVDEAMMAEYPERSPRLFVIAYNALVKLLKSINADFE